MKFSSKYLIPSLLVGTLLVSCDEKPDSNQTKDGPIDAVVETLTPASGDVLQERADALGFARHLPMDTECVLGFYRGKQLLDQVRGSALGKWLEARSAEEGVDLDEVESDPSAQQIGKLFAEEAILAFGASTGTQAGLLVEAASEVNYISVRSALGNLARATGEDALSEEQLIIARLDQYLSLLEPAAMPPVTIALKGGEEASEQTLSMLLSQLEMFKDSPPGVVTDIEFSRAGASFTGLQLNGEKVAELLKEEMGDEVPLTPQQLDKVVRMVSARNLVLAGGVVDGYLVVMIGASVDDCQLVEDINDSVLANDAMGFVDDYADKPVIGAIYASEKLQSQLMENYSGYKAYVDGIKDGLKAIPAFGDIRDLTVVLDRIVSLESRYYEKVEFSDFGALAFLDEGVRLEAFGGMNVPTLDSESPREFAPLAQTDGLVLFANWVGDEEAAKLQGELLNSFGEAAWIFAGKVADLNLEMPDFEEFAGIFGMINSQYSEELKQVVQALRGDLPEGFGGEGVVVVDLNGETPSGIPMVPPVLVEKGKLPRVTFAQRVNDREKLSTAWDSLEKVTKSVLAKTESGVTMPSFLTSEKDGLISYFYPFPFQTDDFLLNLTVGDDVFFLSSSKSFVYELNGRFKAGPADSAKTGAVVEVHFDVLRAYAEDWLKLVDENAEEIFPSEAQAADFNENKGMIKDFIQTLDGLESFTWHLREDNGMPRTSAHLKIN